MYYSEHKNEAKDNYFAAFFFFYLPDRKMKINFKPAVLHLYY